jgi:hypothetical protein
MYLWTAFFDAFSIERTPFRAFLAIGSAATFGQVDLLSFNVAVTIGWSEVLVMRMVRVGHLPRRVDRRSRALCAIALASQPSGFGDFWRRYRGELMSNAGRRSVP